MSRPGDARRRALLSAPRTSLPFESAPPAVRAYARQFPDALSLEVRRLHVEGTSSFEVLRTHARDEFLESAPEGEAPGPDDTFVTGTIVDAEGVELVELDFEEGSAVFLADADEKAHDARLTAFAAQHFTVEALAGALKTAPVPAAVPLEADAKGYRFTFEGRTYYAQAYREQGAWEVLVYDDQGHGLGGCYGVGRADFELAEEEARLPLPRTPRPAAAEASGHDDFQPGRRPRVVL